MSYAEPRLISPGFTEPLPDDHMQGIIPARIKEGQVQPAGLHLSTGNYVTILYYEQHSVMQAYMI